jgi:hypothetical protein
VASAQEVRAKAGEAAPINPEERLVPRGPMTLTGTVKAGQGRHSDLQARMQPDGHLVGFRLELAGGRAIPQVVATGPLGTALLPYIDSLAGTTVEVEGEGYEVQVPGRRAYARVVATRIAGDGWTVPGGD